MKYYRFNSSAEQKVVGKVPQIDGGSLYRKRQKPINHDDFSAEHQNFLNDFQFNYHAKVTDILNCSSIRSEMGFFINEKAYKVLLDYLDANHSCYNLELDGSSKNIGIVPYKFLHLADSTDIIDYENTTFVDLIKKEELNLQSDNEYLDELKVRPLIRPLNNEVYLKGNPQIFRLPKDIFIYISEEVKNALEENKISGYELEPTPYVFKD